MERLGYRCMLERLGKKLGKLELRAPDLGKFVTAPRRGTLVSRALGRSSSDLGEVTSSVGSAQLGEEAAQRRQLGGTAGLSLSVLSPARLRFSPDSGRRPQPVPRAPASATPAHSAPETAP